MARFFQAPQPSQPVPSELERQYAEHADADAQARESARTLELLLQALHAASSEYQYSDLITFGGVTTMQGGALALPSEFATPCEYRVVLVAFADAGTVQVGQNSQAVAPANTTAIDPSLRLRAEVYTAPGAATVAGSGGWTSLPANGVIYAAITVSASHAAYVTVQFRRRGGRRGVYGEGQA